MKIFVKFVKFVVEKTSSKDLTSVQRDSIEGFSMGGSTMVAPR
jgi:hypothetical protein